MNENPLLRLAIILVPLSLAAIGGAGSIYGPLQHQTVDVQQWLTPRDFLDLFAVSRVTPGPGSFIATLIGWKVAGWAGAIVATFAIFAPSCALCLVVCGLWNDRLKPTWRSAIETGLSPIGAGLMLAGVLSVLRVSHSGPVTWILLAASAVIMTLAPRVHPLLLIAIGGLLTLVFASLGGHP
jgi:chromate transporter